MMAVLYNQVTTVAIVLRLLVTCSATDNETVTWLPEVSERPENSPLVAVEQTTATPLPPSTTAPTVGTTTTRNLFIATTARPDLASELVRHSMGRGFNVLPHYHQPDSRWGPFFEEGSEPHNITARVGSTVMLDCRIGLLQDQTVTWLRHKGESQMHLLTVGMSAYSRDERITLSFRYPFNWRLSIVYVTRRDEGLYECQVATHPPKVKRFFLKVTAPEVTIVDESGREVTERYYKAGSTLELTCQATQAADPGTEHPVTWRHGDRILTKGISSNATATSDTVISTLTVAPVQKRHSGNYTCAVGTLAFASVSVHVLNGELPAAVHHGNAAPQRVAPWLLVSLALASALARLR